MTAGEGGIARREVAAEVLGICAGVLLLEPDGLGEDARLFEELGAESIDVLDIMTQLEERFGAPAEVLLPFLDRAFYEAAAGHFEGDRLSPKGQAALVGLPFLDGERLVGEDGRGYLASIAPLVDLAHWSVTEGGLAADLRRE